MKKIEIGSDFSGIGAFDHAIKRVCDKNNIKVNNIFACDMDKFAREAYLENNNKPGYYPLDVYEREIPKKSLDIYMTSPPCQSFSLAGKRKGKEDERGVLFFNSYEFIKENKPRFFIFENVKGLLSDDSGKTFGEWVNYLGGKSVNGLHTFFPHEDSVPYHIHHRVLNSKKHGVPQNRERVFIVGIRDDQDNSFTWPKEEHLTKRLVDVLESNVDEKYYLSDKLISFFIKNTAKNKANGNGFAFKPKKKEDTANSLTTKAGSRMDDNFIKVKSATQKGYETATENDSINYCNPKSETRRGRVGKGVAQTLDTGCQQGVLIGAIRGRNPINPKSRKTGLETKQMLEINETGTSNCLTTVQKDNVAVQLNTSKESGGKQPYQHNRVYSIDGLSPFLDTDSGRRNILIDYRIRRLTPRECLRLQGFPDTFKIVCSDSQTYKQAGNSITVRVLELISEKIMSIIAK